MFERQMRGLKNFVTLIAVFYPRRADKKLWRWLLLLMLMAVVTLTVLFTTQHPTLIHLRGYVIPIASMYGKAELGGRHLEISSKLQSPNHRLNFQSDLSEYDVEEVSRWYRGSRCSGLRHNFVGSQPLFAPCRAGVPHGTPTWGTYPYVGPFRYRKESKNPCWGQQGGGLRCLPYFFLIGVSKSATSDLFARITQHPHVVRTPKEPHWFDRKRYGLNMTFESYTGRFAALTAEVERDIDTSGRSFKICGDASPSYFYDNNNWPKFSGNEGCKEPRVILANQIRHLNPAVKIVLIMRHPVERLYSRFLFDLGGIKLLANKTTAETFHEYVTEGLQKYRQCFNTWTLRHCIYNKTLSLSVHKLRIQESFYDILLEDWLRVIPRQQILILRFDDYKRNEKKQLERLYHFLGLDLDVVEGRMDSIVSTKIKNKGRRKESAGPMLDRTEKLLSEFYQPFIRRLATILQDDAFLWKDWSIETVKT